MNQNILQKGLYDPSFEHDNCGIGAVVDIKGKKSHQIVVDALRIVENLEHRAGKDAEGETGDGVGILTQISHRFFKKVCRELEICNRRRVLVENHQGVSGYTSEEVQVNTATGAICVSGRKLNLMKMTRFQLVITGEILAVTFKERN